MLDGSVADLPPEGSLAPDSYEVRPGETRENVLERMESAQQERVMVPLPPLKVVGINGLLVLMTVYFFQGIAIVSYVFEKKAFPRALRILLYTLIAVQQFLAVAVIGLGFFDIWMNFRKLNKENGE